MRTIQADTGGASPRTWLEVNHRVRISSQAVRRVRREGLKLIDLDLVLPYGERLAEGYYMSDDALYQALQSIRVDNSSALRERLSRLRNVVVVEMMDTILTTYRLPERGPAEAEPMQREFVLH